MISQKKEDMLRVLRENMDPNYNKNLIIMKIQNYNKMLKLVNTIET